VVPAKYIPIEFGAANLLPADVINHYQHGLFGALIIEPVGAEGWNTTDGITAVVSTNQVRFREFVLAYQDALSNPLSTPAFGFDYDAINLRTEPLFSNPNGNNQRFCDSQCTIPSGGTPTNVGCVLAGNTQAKTNSYCCTAYTTTNNVTTCTSCSACATPPATPTLRACAGEQVRLRLVHAGGSNTDQVFELFGHVWAETPYMSVGPGCIPPTTHTNLYSSSTINDQHRCTPQFLGQDGYNATLASFGAVSDSLTDWQGSRMGHGPGNHYDILINSAGGINKVPGDYLFRTYPAMHFRLGPWGIFQVVSPGDPLCKATY
jgi:manganese oxidase